MRRCAAALLAALLLWTTSAVADGVLRVHFFDVGQGDAVLIQSPSGQNVIYDAGESSQQILMYLDALAITRVDLVIASHNHVDHIGGLPGVVHQFHPRFYLENGIPATTLTYQRVLEAVGDAGTQLLAATSRRVSLGEVTLQVLPPPRINAEEQNVNSLGVIVEYGKFRLSLGGDAEQPEWAWWLEHYNPLLGKVQVHKSSHHGSSNGDSLAALERLSPTDVIISCGRDNPYGHPTKDTLALYSGLGARVHRTDVEGSILLSAYSSGIYTLQPETFSTYSQQNPRNGL